MNKKLMLLVFIALLFIVGVCVCLIPHNKYKTTFTIGDYQFVVDAKKEDINTSNENVKFITSLKIRNEEDKNTDIYHVEFLNFDADDVIYDMRSPDGQFQINGKTLSYWCGDGIGSCESGNSIIYFYYPIDENKEVPIRVSGSTTENDDGTQCKCIPIVTKDVLQSKELSKILKFKVKKIGSK